MMSNNLDGFMIPPFELNLTVERNTGERSEFKPNLIFKKNDKLIIRISPSRKPSLLNIYNPNNRSIFNQWSIPGVVNKSVLSFPRNFLTGQYLLQYSFENGVYNVPFQFSGQFKNQQWLLTYTVTINNNIPDLEIRLALPKQYLPFIMIDHIEGQPQKHNLTTDAWSNWLIFDLADFPASSSRVMLGYRAWISMNYILFSPDCFLNAPITSNQEIEELELSKYLQPEPGIESNDKFIKDFALNISAQSVIGIIYQIIFLVHNHVKFDIQQGEFGAKYALLNRRGDCTELAALFVALCRVKKVPARLVAGLKKEGEIWIRHAWAEFFYEGLWIPIDVVEGYLIGILPNLIPLFKGNWMAENMFREFKINSKDNSQVLDLSQINYDLKFKVYSKSEAPIPYPEIDVTASLVETKFNISKNILNDDKFELILTDPIIDSNTIFTSYFKPKNDDFKFLQPKVVSTIFNMSKGNLDSNGKDFKISEMSPIAPNFYEYGFFINSTYGQLISWESTTLNVISKN